MASVRWSEGKRGGMAQQGLQTGGPHMEVVLWSLHGGNRLRASEATLIIIIINNSNIIIIIISIIMIMIMIIVIFYDYHHYHCHYYYHYYYNH